MSAQRDMVMTHDNVVRKLDRMARELLEVHFQESSLVLIGVAGQGVALCEALSSRLQALSNLEVVTGTLTMHKDLPLEHELHLPLGGCLNVAMRLVPVLGVIRIGLVVAEHGAARRDDSS